jgi:hypothetical protein
VKPNLEWAKAVGAQVIVLIFLMGGLATLGLFPWATEKDLDARRAHYEAEIADLNVKYDATMALKNQDNIWYRELNQKVAAGLAQTDARLANLEAGLKELGGDIKQLLRDRSDRGRR